MRQVEVMGREFSIVGEPGRRERQMTPPHSNRAVEVQNRVGDIADVDHHAIVERPGLQLARSARLSPTTGKTHRSLRIQAGDWRTGDAGGQVTFRQGV